MNIFVSPYKDGKYQVKIGGHMYPEKVTRTQIEAINFAHALAKQFGGEIVIQGKNGKIRQKNSYGNDPYPPIG